jgi:hypothetical protein
MKRREFIAGLGSAAAWPMVPHAQQPVERIRLAELLTGFAEGDPAGQSVVAAFRRSKDFFV